MSTNQLTQYSPDQITIAIGAIRVDGFADGTFVALEQETPTFSKVTGADGKTTRVKSLNRSGQVTITLMQTSLSNDFLSALHIVDRDTPGGATVPMFIRDRGGRSLFTAAQCWISTPPKPEYSRDNSTREWVIEFAKVERNDGGN